MAPFLLPALSHEYGVGLGTASLATAGQLAGFVLGSWGAGRFLEARGRVLGVALGVLAVMNLGSALLPPFALLCCCGSPAASGSASSPGSRGHRCSATTGG